ncbi:MAG: galactokinase [Pirellulaceae bacterium]
MSEARRAQLSRAFKQQFGSEPTWWVRAPGRVDLMGSHTDYNHGFVLTLSIDRDTWIAARATAGRRARLHSLNLAESVTFDLDESEARTEGFGRYVQAVAMILRDEGYPLCGFDAIVHSTVPLRSGLSSSAALEAATAVLLSQLGSFTIEPVRLARLCQRAENQIVGMQCGILDQYSSILGRAGTALVLDCRHLTHRCAQLSADVHVVIGNTCAPRELMGSEYGERGALCEEGARRLGVPHLRDMTLEQFTRRERELPVLVARRTRFILEESSRVERLAHALTQNDRAALGRLTASSYAGARDLFEIGAPAMDAMMRAMTDAPGAIGARQAGAGFGGCLVAFVEQRHLEPFLAHVHRQYAAETGITPEIYAVIAANGAEVLPE